MKIECDRNSFLDALSAVATAVPHQSVNPIAMDVLLQCNEKGLKLQNTDLSIFIEVNIFEVTQHTAGDALVPVKRLLALVRELSTKTLTIDRQEDMFAISLSAGEDGFQIMGHDPGDFPTPPEFPDIAPLVMENAILLEAFQKVSFAASKDPSKEQLQGVSCVFEGKKACFVATDGKRLSEFVVSLPQAMEKRCEGIIPIRAVDVIEKFLALTDSDVSVYLNTDAQQIMFKHDRGQVLCRLLQGQMPDYLSLIPTDYSTTVDLNANDFLTAVRKAAVMTTRENAVVSLDIASQGFTVSVSSQDVGSGKVVVEGAQVNGEAFTAFYPVSNIVDGLRVLGESQVRLNLKADGPMAVLKAGKHFRYVFMRIKLKNDEPREEA